MPGLGRKEAVPHAGGEDTQKLGLVSVEGQDVSLDGYSLLWRGFAAHGPSYCCGLTPSSRQTLGKAPGTGAGAARGNGLEQEPPRGHFPKAVSILPPPPATPAAPPRPLPCCPWPPAGQGLPRPAATARGRQDGKLHTTVSGQLPARRHLLLLLRLLPRTHQRQ